MEFSPSPQNYNIVTNPADYNQEDLFLVTVAGPPLTCIRPCPLWKCEYEAPKISPRNFIRYFAPSKNDAFVELDKEMCNLLQYRKGSIERLYQTTSTFRRMLDLHDTLLKEMENSIGYKIMESIHWYCRLYMDHVIPSVQTASPLVIVHCLTAAGEFHRFISDRSRPSLAYPSEVDCHRSMAETLRKEAFDRAIARIPSKSHPIFLDAAFAYIPYTRTTAGDRGPTDDISKIIAGAEIDRQRLVNSGQYLHGAANEEEEEALEIEAERVTIALRALAFEWSEEDKKALGHTQIPLSTF